MNAPRMSDRFASTFRATLIEHIAHQQNPRRKRRIVLGSAAALSLVLGGTVAATASGLLALPGATEVTTAGAVQSQTFTGTGSLELGPRPEGATGVSISFTCLSPGTFVFSDGASVTCVQADVASTSNRTTYLLPLDAIDKSAVHISTSSAAVWTLTAGYVMAEVTDWAVNESGDTYGVINDRGQPDLIAAVATNGLQGYVYRRDLEDANGATAAKGFTSPEDALEWQEQHEGQVRTIPVYEPDGVTVFGEFRVG